MGKKVKEVLTSSKNRQGTFLTYKETCFRNFIISNKGSIRVGAIANQFLKRIIDASDLHPQVSRRGEHLHSQSRIHLDSPVFLGISLSLTRASSGWVQLHTLILKRIIDANDLHPKV